MDTAAIFDIVNETLSLQNCKYIFFTFYKVQLFNNFKKNVVSNVVVVILSIVELMRPAFITHYSTPTY